MGIKKGLLSSKGEEKTDKILKKYSSYLKVYPKVRFFEVFDWNTKCTTKEHEYLEKTDFDFVICRPQQPYEFLFVIEFDGIGKDYPNIDPYRKIKKETKIKICKQEKFPLLWIETEHIENIEGETILDVIIDSYINGNYFDNLREISKIKYDDSYVYEFKPLKVLLNKYGVYLREVYTEIPKEEKTEFGVIKLQGVVMFNTNQGIKQIKQLATMRAIHFPYFHDLEFVEDLSHYLCLKELEREINKGKYKLVE